MGSMAVSGLLTGFDTKAVVQQLMSVERNAGKRLTTAHTTATALSSAFTKLNGLVKSMGDAAKAVIPDPIMKTSVWNTASTTSSNKDAVTATASEKAVPGSVTFTVNSVARAGAAVSSKEFTDRNSSLSADAFDLTIAKGADPTAAGAKTTKISLAGGATLNDVARAITDSDAGVNATVVQVKEGTYRLQLTSKDTGAASNVTLTDGNMPPGAHALLGSFNRLYNGVDTQLTVGEGANAYTVTSNTTKVTDLLPGVTMDVKATSATPVTISAAKDPSAMADKVEAMVKAANEALSNVRINSKVDPNLEKGKSENNSGLFMGNATARATTQQITDVFVGSSSNLPSVVGINLDKTGAVSFDRAKFLAEYAKDPAKVEASVTNTAQRLVDVSKQLTDTDKGTLTAAVKGQDAAVKDYVDQMKRFDERMTMKEQQLTRQFNALDSMLSKMKSQSDWLAGQLKGLEANNSK